MSKSQRMSVRDYRALVAGKVPPADSRQPGGLDVQAHGSLPPDRMNGLERRYAAHLDDLKRVGQVLWWDFGSITFRLGNDCRYTPDFPVLFSDGRLEMHETKGFWRDDARVKIRVAADRFPIRFNAIKALSKRDGGGWAQERF